MLKNVIIIIRKSFFMTVGLVLLSSVSLASAEIFVVNGSFEFPDIPTGSSDVVASIPGWTTTFGCGIEIQDHFAGSPHAREQHVELDSFCPSGMVQSLPTEPGKQYNVCFVFSPRPGVVDNGIRVKWDGTVVMELHGDGAGLTDTAWVKHCMFGLAASSTITTSLGFEDISSDDGAGGYIDGVRVKEKGTDTGAGHQ